MVQRIHVDGMGEVEFPDGMSDAEIVSAIRRSSQPQPKPINPTDGMSTADKLLSGVGKAFYDVGRGAGALVTDAFPSTAKYGLSTRKDIDEAKKIDAPLMNTGAGFTGNLIGNIAAFAPIAAIPGANTITGGALIGAATGALQPVGTDDSRMMNSTTGGLFGAALPAVVSGAKAAKAALVEPFTSKGQTAIASRVKQKALPLVLCQQSGKLLMMLVLRHLNALFEQVSRICLTQLTNRSVGRLLMLCVILPKRQKKEQRQCKR